MTAMPDEWIREMAKKHHMIEPCADLRKRSGRISFGISSYGYDFRLADEYKIPDFDKVKTLDPKKADALKFRDHKGSCCWLPPNSFVLGRSLEYFRIPRDIIVLCQGKSTYARSGIIVNVTPLEPEWEGFITISLANTSPVAVKVYSEEGIAQAVFVHSSAGCRVSYADRKGKYQGQQQIHLSKV